MAGPEQITVEDRLDPWLLLRRAYLMLSGNALTWAIVLMAFGLFVSVAVAPNVWRFAGACVFTVVMMPLAWREKRK